VIEDGRLFISAGVALRHRKKSAAGEVPATAK
jgi:hypothetical protein